MKTGVTDCVFEARNLGYIYPGNIKALSGLNLTVMPGEMVVTDGQLRLGPGMQVKVVNGGGDLGLKESPR